MSKGDGNLIAEDAGSALCIGNSVVGDETLGKEILTLLFTGVSFAQGALRIGSKERTGLSSSTPARASPGLNVLGVMKSVRCSSSSGGGVQTGTVSLHSSCEGVAFVAFGTLNRCFVPDSRALEISSAGCVPYSLCLLTSRV